MASIIYNDKLTKIYKKLYAGLNDIQYADSLLMEDKKLDIDNDKEGVVLHLIIETKELCIQVRKCIKELIETKHKQLKDLLDGIKKFDECIDNDNKGMLDLMVMIRSYCVERDNFGHTQKQQILKKMDIVTEKFHVISTKCKKI